MRWNHKNFKNRNGMEYFKVNADSQTPYTDALNFYGLDPFLDRPNAYDLWVALGRRTCSLDPLHINRPSISNSVLQKVNFSKEQWERFPVSRKMAYYAEAVRLRKFFHQEMMTAKRKNWPTSSVILAPKSHKQISFNSSISKPTTETLPIISNVMLVQIPPGSNSDKTGFIAPYCDIFPYSVSKQQNFPSTSHQELQSSSLLIPDSKLPPETGSNIAFRMESASKRQNSPVDLASVEKSPTGGALNLLAPYTASNPLLSSFTVHHHPNSEVSHQQYRPENLLLVETMPQHQASSNSVGVPGSSSQTQLNLRPYDVRLHNYARQRVSQKEFGNIAPVKPKVSSKTKAKRIEVCYSRLHKRDADACETRVVHKKSKKGSGSDGRTVKNFCQLDAERFINNNFNCLNLNIVANSYEAGERVSLEAYKCSRDFERSLWELRAETKSKLLNVINCGDGGVTSIEDLFEWTLRAISHQNFGQIFPVEKEGQEEDADPIGILSAGVPATEFLGDNPQEICEEVFPIEERNRQRNGRVHDDDIQEPLGLSAGVPATEFLAC